MQQIVTAVLAAGKTPYLAKVPFATLAGISQSALREYNAVIDELVALNGITVTPPNFYRHFKTHPSELADGLHPTETGYHAMGKMWFNVLKFID